MKVTQRIIISTKKTHKERTTDVEARCPRKRKYAIESVNCILVKNSNQGNIT